MYVVSYNSYLTISTSHYPSHNIHLTRSFPIMDPHGGHKDRDTGIVLIQIKVEVSLQYHEPNTY